MGTDFVKMEIIRTSFFRLFFSVAILTIFLSFVPNALAQNSPLGITNRVPISGTSVLDGYIVTTSSSGFETSSTAYQPNMIGVVTDNPGIELKTTTSDSQYPLQTSGEAMVWVSVSNGMIVKGDRITSSPWEGIGMKSTIPGPYIGTAVEDIKVDSDADLDQTVTKIRIVIEPGDSSIASADKPDERTQNKPFNVSSLTRFIVGSVIVIVTIFMSLAYFGKLSRSGVEAIGRNPVAYKKIQFGVAVSIVIGFLIAIVGIISALYIMNLG
ncbi:hypothetical protein KBD81_05580 [Candidatus Woesebacteria bacterium]|nr:hypothetical protein [Candidatus Woesebacteria bacterium]